MTKNAEHDNYEPADETAVAEFEFDFSQESAKQADAAGNRLSDYGAFVGDITDLIAWKNDKGWQGFILTVTTQFDGQLKTWVMTKGPDKNGQTETKAARKWIDGIMLICGVKRLVGEVRQAEGEVPVRCYPELIGKQIGIIVNKVKDEKGFESCGLVGLFHAKTNLTPTEIMDGRTTPKLKEKITKNEAKFIDRSKGKGGSGAVNEDAATPLASNYDV